VAIQQDSHEFLSKIFDKLEIIEAAYMTMLTTFIKNNDGVLTEAEQKEIDR